MSKEGLPENIEKEIMAEEKSVKEQNSNGKSLQTTLLGMVAGLMMLAVTRLFSINSDLIRFEERFIIAEENRKKDAGKLEELIKDFQMAQTEDAIQNSRLTIIESKLK